MGEKIELNKTLIWRGRLLRVMDIGESVITLEPVEKKNYNQNEKCYILKKELEKINLSE